MLLKWAIDNNCTYITGKFQMYDFGLIQNLMRYHSISPPDYNLRSITAPVVLYYASNDRLSAIKVSKHTSYWF